MSKIALLIGILLLGATLQAEKLYIPPPYELERDEAKISECNRKLEVDNCLALVKDGLIQPGWIELDHPNVRFQLAYNRWIKLWNEAIEKNMIDYNEVVAFDKMVKSFEKFVDRVEKERKLGQ